MKKLLFLILLVMPFTLHAEKVILDTPYDKEISIDIPEDYESLKDLTIQISELYWGERYDLEIALKDNEGLLKDIDKLNEQIDKLKIQLKDTTDLLDKASKPELFQWNIIGGAGFIYKDDMLFSANVGFGITLWETLSFHLVGEYPVGLKLFCAVSF